MATLKEIARDYRRAAARLVLWLEEHADADPARVRAARQALAEVREAQRALDGYYDLPRPEGLCAVGWRAGTHNDD